MHACVLCPGVLPICSEVARADIAVTLVAVVVVDTVDPWVFLPRILIHAGSSYKGKFA